MDTISEVLAQWSQGQRRAAARGLLMELGGRSNAPAPAPELSAHPAEQTSVQLTEMVQETPTALTAEPPAAVKKEWTTAENLLRELRADGTDGPAEGKLPAAVELDGTEREVSAVREPGAYMTLRRKVPELSAPAEAEQSGIRWDRDAAKTGVRQMREISDWFRRDSRRYDPGYTRY